MIIKGRLIDLPLGRIVWDTNINDIKQNSLLESYLGLPW